MSIQSYQSNVSRIRKEIAAIEKQISDEAKKDVDKSKQVAQLRKSMTGNMSVSSFQSKLDQLNRLLDDASRIQVKRAELSKKLSDKFDELHRNEQSLMREEERERQRVADAQKRREREQLDHQRAITRELVEQRRLSVLNVDGVVAGASVSNVAYDLFISHATEDKDEFVRPLAQALEDLGVKVWFDESTLKVGDSLRRSIDAGLARSRFGVVVLSGAFFKKQWPQYEMDGLIAREMNGRKVVLPIWHKVSKDEVMGYSPSLADKVALNSSIMSIAEIASELAGVVRGD